MATLNMTGHDGVSARLDVNGKSKSMGIFLSGQRITELGWALDRALNCGMDQAPAWLLELSDMCNAAKEKP